MDIIFDRREVAFGLLCHCGIDIFLVCIILAIDGFGIDQS